MDQSEQDTVNSTPVDLSVLRKLVDGIDGEILDLINRRLEMVQEIGRCKRRGGGGVLDRQREAAVIDRLVKRNKGPLTQEDLQHIFMEIISVARQIQRPHSVAYLGTEATFIHVAAMQRFGHFVKYRPQPSIDDLFREVERDSCHFGVVPVENAMEGAVNHILDVFLDTKLTICGEIYQKVAFDLLARSNGREAVQVVYAQPQASALCRGWLRRHLPGAVIRETDTTARALAKAIDRPGAAALASLKVAPAYDMNVLDTSINDSARCMARFLIVGNRIEAPTGHDKTSVMFAADDRPGALQRVLNPIAEAGINLINITSHPTGHADWKDFFLVDLQGHRDEAAVQEALDKMTGACRHLKCLGSYPMADTAPQDPGDGSHAD